MDPTLQRRAGWGVLGAAASSSGCLQLFSENVYLHSDVDLCYCESSAFFPVICYFLEVVDFPQPMASACPDKPTLPQPALARHSHSG